jgi:hypothetical protein
MHMHFGFSHLSPAAFQEELPGQCIQGTIVVRAVVDDMHGAKIMNNAKTCT